MNLSPSGSAKSNTHNCMFSAVIKKWKVKSYLTMDMSHLAVCIHTWWLQPVYKKMYCWNLSNWTIKYSVFLICYNLCHSILLALPVNVHIIVETIVIYIVHSTFRTKKSWLSAMVGSYNYPVRAGKCGQVHLCSTAYRIIQVLVYGLLLPRTYSRSTYRDTNRNYKFTKPNIKYQRKA